MFEKPFVQHELTTEDIQSSQYYTDIFVSWAESEWKGESAIRDFAVQLKEMVQDEINRPEQDEASKSILGAVDLIKKQMSGASDVPSVTWGAVRDLKNYSWFDREIQNVKNQIIEYDRELSEMFRLIGDKKEFLARFPKGDEAVRIKKEIRELNNEIKRLQIQRDSFVASLKESVKKLEKIQNQNAITSLHEAMQTVLNADALEAYQKSLRGEPESFPIHKETHESVVGESRGHEIRELLVGDRLWVSVTRVTDKNGRLSGTEIVSSYAPEDQSRVEYILHDLDDMPVIPARFPGQWVMRIVRIDKPKNESREIITLEPAQDYYHRAEVLEPARVFGSSNIYEKTYFGKVIEYYAPDGSLVQIRGRDVDLINQTTGRFFDTGEMPLLHLEHPLPALKSTVSGKEKIVWLGRAYTKRDLEAENALTQFLLQYIPNEKLPVREQEPGEPASGIGVSMNRFTRIMSAIDKQMLRNALLGTREKPGPELPIVVSIRYNQVVNGLIKIMNDKKYEKQYSEKIRSLNLDDKQIRYLPETVDAAQAIVDELVSVMSEQQRRNYFQSDMDAEASVLMFRAAGLNVRVTPVVQRAQESENLEVFNEYRTGAVHVDISHGSGVRLEPDEKTGKLRVFLDQDRSIRSASRAVDDLLRHLGFWDQKIDKDERRLMLYALDFVDSVDNFRGPAYDSKIARRRTYRNPRNVYNLCGALMQEGGVDALLQFFYKATPDIVRQIKINHERRYAEKKEKAPPLTLARLRERVLGALMDVEIDDTNFEMTDNLRDTIRAKEDEVSSIRKIVNVLRKKGFELDTQYGKILFDPGQQLVNYGRTKDSATTRHAPSIAFVYGYDGYVGYNVLSGKCVINITGFKDHFGDVQDRVLPHNFLRGPKGEKIGEVTKDGRYFAMNPTIEGGIPGGLRRVLDELKGKSTIGMFTSKVEALLNEEAGAEDIESRRIVLQHFRAALGLRKDKIKFAERSGKTEPPHVELPLQSTPESSVWNHSRDEFINLLVQSFAPMYRSFALQGLATAPMRTRTIRELVRKFVRSETHKKYFDGNDRKIKDAINSIMRDLIPHILRTETELFKKRITSIGDVEE